MFLFSDKFINRKLFLLFMQVMIDLEKENVDELKKAIEVLSLVISNKEQGIPFHTGLEKFNAPNEAKAEQPKQSYSAPEPAARTTAPPANSRVAEQNRLYNEINLSDFLLKKKGTKY